MAIYQQIYRKIGTNTAAISFGASTSARFPGRMRIRMSELEEFRYGACNVLRVVNKSTKRCRVHFSWGVDNDRYEDVEANSIRNVTVDDGYNFYGFDLENLDTAADIAIGEIHYTMAKVEQFKEG